MELYSLYKGGLTAFKGDRKKASCKCSDWMDSLNFMIKSWKSPWKTVLLTCMNHVLTWCCLLDSPAAETVSKQGHVVYRNYMGHVAALVRSHAIGLLPFRLTKEQTTQTMDPSPKTIELLHYPGQWNFELTGSCYSTELYLFSFKGSRDHR